MRKSYLPTLVIGLVLAAIFGTNTIAAPLTPPPGGYTGGIFSYYFRNIIEGSGSIVGTTSGGVCPAGQVIRGFSITSGTYGLPICVNPTSDDGSASSLTGSLRGTGNYIPKYSSTGTGIINSQIFDDGTNIGIGLGTPGASLEIQKPAGTTMFVLRNGSESAFNYAIYNSGSSPVNNETFRQGLRYGTTWNGYIGFNRGGGGTDGGVIIGTNNTERLRVLSNGNVGIGTSSPGQKLDVSGGSIRTTNQFISTLATGTSPLSVTSTTVNTNLNADLLDGQHGSYYLPVASVTGTTNYLGKFTGTNTVGVSQIFDNGTNVGIGTTTPTSKFEVWDGAMSIFHARGTNLGVGAYASNYLGAGGNNLGIGNLSLANRTSAWNNLAYGGYALYSTTTGNSNTAFGEQSLRNNVSGSNNLAIGQDSLYSNVTASDNIALGVAALYSNTLGSRNTAIGVNAANLLSSGDNNIALGYNVNLPSPTGSNQLNIGNWIYGDNGNIGIGTSTSLTARLSVNGQIKITGGSPAAGRVLTSDATGLASWQVPSYSEGDPKVGTLFSNYLPKWGGSALTDSQVFDNGTNVGIGTSTPSAKLEINGQIKITGGSPGSGKVLISDAAGMGSWGTVPSDIAVGSIMAFNSATCPAGWIPADGTNGTPDLRGEFIRGLDAGRGVDIGRLLGTSQSSSVGDHIHSLSTGVTTGTGALPAVSKLINTEGVQSLTGGVETRPRNVALLYCMRNINSSTATSSGLTWTNTDGTSSGNVVLATTGRVGIGTITPSAKLEVNGDIVINGIKIGRGSGSLIGSTLVGTDALNNLTTGLSNTAIGANTLRDNTTGSSNTAVGVNALRLTTIGSSNTAIGTQAGGNITSGDGNITIGAFTNAPSATGSNQLNIGNWIFGNNGNIGIGTGSNLEQKLTIAGDIRIIDGNQGNGKLLTSDENGVASWKAPAADLPIGTVMAFNSTSCPAGWAIADGTSGTPDLRGEFVRGLDSGRGVDTGRILGSSQSDNIRQSSFIVRWNSDTRISGWSPTGAFTSVDEASGLGRVNGGVSGLAAQHTKITLGSATETRPRNVALLYCIKMTTYATPGDPTTWQNLSGTSSGNVTLATSGNVGVGTNTPTEKLEVQGSIKIVDGNQGTGKVLVSDGTGKGRWETMPGDLPVGSIMAFNGTSCPAGWAIANGAGGTPDLRGEFVRGLDMGRGVDSGRVLGTAQGGATRLLMNGSSIYNAPEGNSPVGIIAHKQNVEMIGIDDTTWGIYTNRNSLRDAMDTTWGGASETRPRNVALLYCQKVSAGTPSVSDESTWMNVDGTSSGRVVLATTGNVGIGTFVPTSKLDIVDATNMPTTPALNSVVPFKISNGTSEAILIDSNQIESVGGGLNLNYRTTTDNITMSVGGGNVGIGTATPTHKLDIQGMARIDQGASYDVWIQGGSSTSTQTRNLALLGVKSTDTLYLNYGGEYVGGTQVGGSLFAGAFYYNSDIKLKKDIKKIESPLEKILKLNGYTFNWKDTGRADIGVIAQEVEKVFPEIVSEKSEEDGSKTKTVQYGNLIAPIIEAIRDLVEQIRSLHTLIEEQQSSIRELQSENAELKKRLDAIEARLAQ